jgi:hypothetical protein
MSTFYSADARSILPPYFPFDRNIDALFGEMVSIIYPGSYFAYLNSNLRHLPPESRSYKQAKEYALSINKPSGELTESFIRNYLARKSLKQNSYYLWTSNSNSDEAIKKIMSDISSDLKDVGKLPEKEFYNWCLQERILGTLGSVKTYNDILDRYSKPSYWKEDVEYIRDSLVEFSEKINTDYCKQFYHHVQSEMAEYGKFLEIWPDLLELAKHYRTKKNGFLGRKI